MPKKDIKNSDLCGRFADIRKLKNINKKRFADTLGINQSVAGDIELGYREPSRDVLTKLASVYDVNINWLLTGEGEMLLSKLGQEVAKTAEGYKVPLLKQKVSCGPGLNWEDEQNIAEYIDIFSIIPRLASGRLYAMIVQGTSMIGTGIRNGDYVLFDPQTEQILKDGTYVFSLDNEIYCKRLEFDKLSKKVKVFSVRVADLEKADLLVTLKADESDFTERLHIFGYVVGYIRPNLYDA